MTSREELIEEAARAAEHWRWAEERRQRFGDQGCVCEVCEVFAVFEQAHTPTSDEREAHEFAQAQWPDLGVGGDADHYNKIARARFLEGVEWHTRRTVQGEPLPDYSPPKPMRTYFDGLDQGQSTSEALKKALAERCTCGHVEHDDNGGECYESGCKCRAWEVQGEPTDAEVEAEHRAWSGYWDRDEGGEDQPAMRAALRNAAAVREEASGD